MRSDSTNPPPSRFGAVADLLVVAVVVAAMLGTTYIPDLVPGTVRFAVGALFALFAPGYAFAAALFPAAHDGAGVLGARSERRAVGSGSDASVSLAARAVLSLGLSVASVPLVGLLLNFTPWGIYLGSVLATLGAVTLLFVVVAGYRRARLPPEARFGLRVRPRLAAVREWAASGETEFETALNVALVACLVLAMAGATFVVVTPTEGERYTEFYLLSEDPETGSLVADDYPRQFETGEGKPLVVGLRNHEGETRNYTVVVLLQRVEYTNESATVLETTRLDRFETDPVAQNETWQRRHAVTPDVAGEDLRLTYLLYVGDPPENVSTATAYRHTHIWVDVSEPGTGVSQSSLEVSRTADNSPSESSDADSASRQFSVLTASHPL